MAGGNNTWIFATCAQHYDTLNFGRRVPVFFFPPSQCTSLHSFGYKSTSWSKLLTALPRSSRLVEGKHPPPIPIPPSLTLEGSGFPLDSPTDPRIAKNVQAATFRGGFGRARDGPPVAEPGQLQDHDRGRGQGVLRRLGKEGEALAATIPPFDCYGLALPLSLLCTMWDLDYI